MKIKFLPQNVEVEGSSDKSVLQIALENKLEIRSICKGVPSCAECRVKVVEGGDNTLPPSKAELNLIGTSHYLDGRRLSCQVRCFGDITVDLSEQVEKIENQTKKIRGFRTSKNAETTAVNDTMLLDEKVDEKSADSNQEPKNKPEQRSAQSSGKGPQQQNSGPKHNKPHHHKNQNNQNNNNQNSNKNNNNQNHQKNKNRPS